MEFSIPADAMDPKDIPIYQRILALKPPTKDAQTQTEPDTPTKADVSDNPAMDQLASNLVADWMNEIEKANTELSSMVK